MLNFDGLFGYLIDGPISEDWLKYLIKVLMVLAVIAASYLLGSVNSAIIVSKVMYRDDIRTHGSGNAGLTNMLRTYGKKAAAFTLIGDMLKTALAIAVAAGLLGIHYIGGINYDEGFCYMAGLFAVLGHVFPVYYGFKGGKGVLVTSTMALILTPIPFAILLAIFVGIVAASGYVSLGSVSVATLYPILVNGYILLFFDGAPLIISLCTIILAVFIVWCHRENLERISNRTERKISFKKKDVEVQSTPDATDSESDE